MSKLKIFSLAFLILLCLTGCDRDNLVEQKEKKLLEQDSTYLIEKKTAAKGWNPVE